MATQLTNKEKMYLNEQKSYEQMCVQKYSSYAAQAQDPQLRQLFNSLKNSEQQHYNTINQMLSGQVPSMNQSQSQQQGASSQASMNASQTSSSAQNASASALQSSSAQGGAMSSQSGSSAQGNAMSSQSGSSAQGNAMSSQSGAANSTDAELCQDMLMTEKYISGAYDTAIFEFSNADMRQALNHIQAEEQQHGEKIFNYMQSNGMYNVQS